MDVLSPLLVKDHPSPNSHPIVIGNISINSHIPDDLIIISSSQESRRSWLGLTTPLFSNFLFTNLFSIKFLYFFIISSLFPHFNLFVSIFIQSYVNNNLHVSTLDF